MRVGPEARTVDLDKLARAHRRSHRAQDRARVEHRARENSRMDGSHGDVGRRFRSGGVTTEILAAPNGVSAGT